MDRRSAIQSQFGPALRGRVGRIFFAGTESFSIWAGYIEGALRSGVRAAAEVRDYLEQPANPV